MPSASTNPPAPATITPTSRRLRGTQERKMTVDVLVTLLDATESVQGGDSDVSSEALAKEDPRLGARPPSVAIVGQSPRQEKEKD